MLIQLYLQDRLVKVAVLVKQIHLKTNFFACKNGYISYIKKSAKNQVKISHNPLPSDRIC